METMYQRGKIQDESMYYEHLKHDGTLPIIGVNTFQNPNAQVFDESSADDFKWNWLEQHPEEKQACHERTRRNRQTKESDATTAALAQLQEVARTGGNVFRTHGDGQGSSLGQITDALFLPEGHNG